MGDYALAISGQRVPATGRRPRVAQQVVVSLTSPLQQWTVAAGDTRTQTRACKLVLLQVQHQQARSASSCRALVRTASVVSLMRWRGCSRTCRAVC